MSNAIGTKKERLTRIGGSEFASVVDKNPYKKRIDLILEKAGVLANTFEGNELTARGNRLEDEVIALFENQTGILVNNRQGEFTLSPDNCLQLVCHVDGITNDNCVFEAKTTDVRGKVWKDGIPEYYQLQLEFNCNLSGRNKGYIAVGFCDGDAITKFEYYEYEAKMTMEEIIEACQKFTDEVEKFKSMGTINNGKVINSDFDDALVEELNSLNEQIAKVKLQAKVFEDKKKCIEDKLKKAIGKNYGIETDLFKITLGNRVTSPTEDYKVMRSGLKIEYK